MLTQSERFNLHAGPYRRHRFACAVECIIGTSDAPIACPVAFNARKKALIVCGDLVHAQHVESVQAVAHHWGIHPETVRRLRWAVRVAVHNAGTCWPRRQYGRLLNERITPAPGNRAQKLIRATMPPRLKISCVEKSGLPTI